MRLDKIIHTRFYLVGAKIRQGEVSFAIHCCDDVRIGRRRSTGKLQQDCASGTSRAGSKRLYRFRTVRTSHAHSLYNRAL